ncbi:Uncharacterised protein [Bordetella pertussis]|nr:Uncharacterised protein [Bordetella pertussis]
MLVTMPQDRPRWAISSSRSAMPGNRRLCTVDSAA